ncbi:MAG: cysteine--tRNA ligase [Candidatus Omnitrophica bacterium CG1_02_40_15]|nr:MAG: cysteine--tRNA ligase [Candidatus Omnitrophica bacterium CG1_02_40_15]
MSLKIYNTLTRKKEEFKPLKEGNVGIYVCGPTVYDAPHIGHARSAYAFDVIRRYFIYKDYKVKFVRNVTDVDDKIINKAKEEFKGEDLNIAVKDISDKYLKIYHEYMEKLGIMQPDKEPKATEYIEEMENFIKILIQAGVAYASAGDVYFNVRKANGYGKLSNQSFEMLGSGARVIQGENKIDPLDFALWKSVKPDEPSWPSPWGNGRPGWHIECSVMSSDILGDEFDIHGGGIDLVFPHHENEVAQSEGAGKKFARYWIHNGLLTINKEKMAKSLGNFIAIEDILAKYPADALKILFLQTHYSHPVDFSWEKMDEVKKAWERFSILLQKIDGLRFKVKGEKLKETNKKEIGEFRKKFEEAMDDNFNMPEALAALFDLVTYINKNFTEIDLNNAKDVLMELGNVFGLFEQKVSGIDSSKEVEIENMINSRNMARKNRDFKEADRIRKELEEKGIILEDTKNGTTWRRR